MTEVGGSINCERRCIYAHETVRTDQNLPVRCKKSSKIIGCIKRYRRKFTELDKSILALRILA